MASEPPPPPPPPLGVLHRLGRLYIGPPVASGGGAGQGAVAAGTVSLKALGAALDQHVRPPPLQATVLIVGGPGSGKSTFVNALAQELVLEVGGAAQRERRRQQRPPLQWVSSASAPGSTPRLLAEAVEHFPDWRGGHASDVIAACCAGRSASSRLDGVELVEAAVPGEPEDAELLAWLGARADVVVCLLDSRQQPAVPGDVLQWLKALPCLAAQPVSGSGEAALGPASPVPAPPGPPRQALQFVLTKADLIASSSERVRLIAKASKLLTTGLGRGFEILPVAAGDLAALLDGLGAVAPAAAKEVAAPTAAAGRHEAGLQRVVQASQACASRRLEEGLAVMRQDCETLARAVEARLAMVGAAARAGAASNPVRSKLLQCAGALFIVALVVPYFLDDDIEPWVVQACQATAATLAMIFFGLALCVPAPRSTGKRAPGAAAAGRCVEVLTEQRRLLQLLLQQHASWTGGRAPDAGGAGASPEPAGDGDTRAGGRGSTGNAGSASDSMCI